MKPANHLEEILAELRSEHRALDAPPSLEAHLVEQTKRLAAQSRPAPRARTWVLGFSFAFAVLLACGLAVWQLNRKPEPVQSHAMEPSALKPGPALTGSAPSFTSPKSSHHKTTRAIAARNNPARESLTPFVALPASEGLPLPAQASLVRTRIQTSSLRQYGLDVPAINTPQTVLAEVLVGEDGLPRAVRLVP